jgi:hypothetical protein
MQGKAIVVRKKTTNLTHLVKVVLCGVGPHVKTSMGLMHSVNVKDTRAILELKMTLSETRQSCLEILKPKKA